MQKIAIILTFLLLFSACEEKRKPMVKINEKTEHPLPCLKLNPLNKGKEFNPLLLKLYHFDNTCSHQLSISYKKDITCNSGYNASGQSLGKFPKSFLKLEVRDGFTVEYSYYIDLLNNVDEDDVKEGFLRLKNDVLLKKIKKI